MIILLIAIGGAAGAVTRYQVGQWLQPASAGAFPWATFVINVTGSMLLAFLYRYIDATSASVNLKALYGIGFCGAFTTFSAFSFETINLVHEGQSVRAAVYVAASVACCLVGTLAGLRIAGSLIRP